MSQGTIPSPYRPIKNATSHQTSNTKKATTAAAALSKSRRHIGSNHLPIVQLLHTV